MQRGITTILVNPVKEQKVITDTRELAEYIREKIAGIEDMTEEDREKMNAKIMAKLESGKKLSQQEMEYLRQTDPIMYLHAYILSRSITLKQWPLGPFRGAVQP